MNNGSCDICFSFFRMEVRERSGHKSKRKDLCRDQWKDGKALLLYIVNHRHSLRTFRASSHLNEYERDVGRLTVVLITR